MSTLVTVYLSLGVILVALNMSGMQHTVRRAMREGPSAIKALVIGGVSCPHCRQAARVAVARFAMVPAMAVVCIIMWPLCIAFMLGIVLHRRFGDRVREIY